MASVSKKTRISIECVDNADGFRGVVVDDDVTFPIANQQACSLNVVLNINTRLQQGPAFGAGCGHHSSVRPFQSPHYEEEETAMECDPPNTKSDSTGSTGAPPASFTYDDEVSMEVN